MAGKRAATSNLNHDNWDEADQPEESGVFRTASKEELQKRVIRTGRRRVQPGAATQDQKSVFSGFSGFNKAPASSFDFLSNLTNGSGAASNGTAGEKKDSGSPLGTFGTPIASSTALFSTSPGVGESAKSGGLFGAKQMSGDTKSSGAFQTAVAPVSTSTSSFTFGIQTPSNDPKPTPIFGIPSKPSLMFGEPTKSPLTSIDSKAKSPIFGIQSSSASGSVSSPSMIFGVQSKASTPSPDHKMPSVLTSATGSKNSEGNNSSITTSPKSKLLNSADALKINRVSYYSKLKALNESVSDWIKQHVTENPLCILTPIFRDYEKYLQEIDEDETETCKDDKTVENPGLNKKTFDGKNMFADTPGFSTHSSLSASNSSTSILKTTSSGFSLTSTVPTSTSFAFGVSSQPQSSVATVASSTSPATPFSFGIGKELSSNFSANKNTQDQTKEKHSGEDEDKPPKVEFTPIAEENSVFEKRCKIFFKKDGDFIDKGVGTLYIKTVENSSKHQLIVRANTSLGTVLLNFILSEFIPTQRMGKNNVMVICIPTPDSQPLPVPILIRVKSGEEANELLDTLNKYKT